MPPFGYSPGRLPNAGKGIRGRLGYGFPNLQILLVAFAGALFYRGVSAGMDYVTPKKYLVPATILFGFAAVLFLYVDDKFLDEIVVLKDTGAARVQVNELGGALALASASAGN